MPLEDVCNVEYGTRVVKDAMAEAPIRFTAAGRTFQMDESNREDRVVIARFGMSEDCTRLVAGKFFLNDSGLTVSPKNKALLPRYLDYQMLSLNDEIYALGKGRRKKISMSLLSHSASLCPSDTRDQQRIVEILDEAVEGIATRQSQREKNLQNARALFEATSIRLREARRGMRRRSPLLKLCDINTASLSRANSSPTPASTSCLLRVISTSPAGIENAGEAEILLRRDS